MSTPFDATTTLSGATPGWMVVQVGDAHLALPIDSVGEVLPVPDVTPVPMAPSWVAGVTSVRGGVVPVIDVGLRLLDAPASREGRLVLTHADGVDERIGLIVDAIAGLVERGSDPGVPVLDLGALLDPAADVSL